MDRDAYHDDHGISSSGIRCYYLSPREYYERFVARSAAHKQSEAMCFGAALHYMAAGQSDRFAEHVAPIFHGPRRGKPWSEHKACHAGKWIPRPEDAARLVACAEAIQAHPVWRRAIVAQPAIETPIYWIDDDTGLRCKALPDVRAGHVVIDLKTTSQIHRVHRQVHQLGYDIQAAHYVAATGALEYYCLFVETVSPFRTRCLHATDTVLAAAEHIRRICLRGIAAKDYIDPWDEVEEMETRRDSAIADSLIEGDSEHQSYW